MTSSYVMTMDTKDDGLEVVGGKGRSLARMTNAGFHVPGGFQVTTAAYRKFVADNGLQDKILELAKPAVVNGFASFEQASENVQKLFHDNAMAQDVVDEVTSAYLALEGETPAIAVRSSANAEDLPGLSFAGQQETFLNVSGAAEAVAAVKKCWASLWTSQAISYRHQHGVEQDSVAMAVVAQIMVLSEVSGILFTANPATGERSEMVINASFGLGEAVVSGQVTPDTYIIDRSTGHAKETMIGAKEQQIISDGAQGVRIEEIAEGDRDQSSLSPSMLQELVETALQIEGLYDGLPQDIEWAYSQGQLHLLQSRPITNLPVQPVELDWTPNAPAKILYRRQIVENMPDPICPLFDELYLTEGLEAPRNGHSLMVGGGAIFVSLNGFAYQRADWPQMLGDPLAAKIIGVTAEEYAAEREKTAAAADKSVPSKPSKGGDASATDKWKAYVAGLSEHSKEDMDLFLASLDGGDRALFDAMASRYDGKDLAHDICRPKSDNPTMGANSTTSGNEKQIKSWYDKAKPRLLAVGERNRKIDIKSASDEELLAAIREMGTEEGIYWSGNTSHTFGVAKSTDDQLQCFLGERCPDHNFISGQFLVGFESKIMEANHDMYEISKLVKANAELTYIVLVTPADRLLAELTKPSDGGPVLEAFQKYLDAYGHQGYSLDFIEPTQGEDPTGLIATLKAMVADENYDPKNHEVTAEARAAKALRDIKDVLPVANLEYWQFRFRLWFARKYYYIREETGFYFGYTWNILRPMAHEFGQRMVDAGIFLTKEDTYFFTSDELREAIAAREAGTAKPEMGGTAAQRREFREACKRHHPPGTIPEEASQIASVAFKETQKKNDASSNVLNGFAVSPGRLSGPASVIMSPSEFDKMQPGSILVAPLTTPAWTQLFSHATALVTDIGSILAHGSIVAREYGIPAVLGTGDATQRIKHGQMITIDGDAGTVEIHEDDEAAA
jgi:phosphohistidine swiveling domain-containing protein